MALPDGFTITLGSDVERDGMFLELARSSEVVAEAFYSDHTKKISISFLDQPLPIEVVEFLTAEAWRRLPPAVPMDVALEPHHLLDVQTDSGGTQVFIHADAKGLAVLKQTVERLQSKAENGACDHDHLFAADWGGCELSTSDLSEGMHHVSHVKIYGWSKSRLEEHPRDNKS
jgi:hypothetical protein